MKQKIYSAMVNTGHELWDRLGTTTKSHMDTLNLMGMVQIRPLLLAVLAKFDDKEKKEKFETFLYQPQPVCLFLVVWEAEFLKTAIAKLPSK